MDTNKRMSQERDRIKKCYVPNRPKDSSPGREETVAKSSHLG